MTNKQIDQILKECAEAINENRDLRRKCERLQSKNADLERTNEAIQKATAQDILQQMWDWRDRRTPFIADIQELADRYGVGGGRVMNEKQEIKELMLDIPQNIVAYDGNPAGQHLYGEQRQQIAEALYKAGYRKIDIIEGITARDIADWIAFRAFHGGYAEPVQNVLSELSDLIKRNYGVGGGK